MMKTILMMILLINALMLPLTSIASGIKKEGEINQVNYIKLDIKINSVDYKLSNTVKVYGFNGNKYLNVKKLLPEMYIDFKYSSNKNSKTINEIWVQPN